jgi:peptide/nickel transport system permease protein
MPRDLSNLRFYIVKRCLQCVPLIFAVIVISFLLIHLAPGDPVIYLVGQSGASPEYMAMMRQKLGLDLPLHQQFVIYISTILRGDLGYSMVYNQPVIEIIASRVPATLLLMTTAIFFSYLIGIFLGVFASTKPFSFISNITVAITAGGYALPIFWLGQILLIVFAVYLGWFPVVGMTSVGVGGLTGFGSFIDVVWHLFLPVVCLTVNMLALVVYITRTSMLEVLEQDFIVTARAKGLKERTVIYRHALRNALLPVVTLIGQSIGGMIAGAVLTETVFSWPGLGRLTYDAVSTRDYPVLLGMLILLSISVLVANLVTDIVYAKLDPRIRYR